MSSTNDISTCENCASALHGKYCHQCGQSMHNPIRHAGHAIEEFFEAFWHLDGRLWRTLRDLMAPGRAANNYLAGHRARYIPPLRLFVVLSVLTFFLGALTVHFDESDTMFGVDTQAITDAQTIEAVQHERDRRLAGIEQMRAETTNMPGVDPALIRAEIKIRGEAANRIAELRAADGGQAGDPGKTAPDGEPAPAAVEPTQIADPPTVASGGELFSPEHDAWNPERSPVSVGWLPKFANDWLNHRLGIARDNLVGMNGQSGLFFKAFMAAVPSALFVLVPVFALLLKLAYLFERRLYLEHLVVALYSHAFLLIALAVAFVLSALGNWLASHAAWLGSAFDLAWTAVLIWMPVYLLLMQKRVYRQGWPLTTVKYLTIGTIYFFLLVTAAIVMFVARLAQA